MSVEKDTVELYEDKGKKRIKDLGRQMKPKGSGGDWLFCRIKEIMLQAESCYKVQAPHRILTFHRTN